MSFRRNLAEQKFGKLTVLDDRIYQNDKSLWLCRCDCGTEKYFYQCNLVGGKSLTCGCSFEDIPQRQPKDIEGQKFGILTAIECIEKRTSSQGAIWRCTCECGNEIDVAATALMQGGTVSCGCEKSKRAEGLIDYLHLVEGTCIELLESTTIPKNNTSGKKGVYQKSGKWVALIGFKKRKIYLGAYSTFEEAARARDWGEENIHKAFLDDYYAQQDTRKVVQLFVQQGALAVASHQRA